MDQTPEGNIHFLDGVGKLGLGVDKDSHEIILMHRTPLGVVSSELSKEQALQLGIALVRYSGKTFRFAQSPVVGPPPESRQEDGHAEVSSDTGGGGGDQPDGGELGGRPAGAQGACDQGVRGGPEDPNNSPG